MAAGQIPALSRRPWRWGGARGCRASANGHFPWERALQIKQRWLVLAKRTWEVRSQGSVRQASQLQKRVCLQLAEEIQAEVKICLFSCLHAQEGRARRPGMGARGDQFPCTGFSTWGLKTSPTVGELGTKVVSWGGGGGVLSLPPTNLSLSFSFKKRASGEHPIHQSFYIFNQPSDHLNLYPGN